MHKAVILDRDGTLNRDDGYVHKVEHLEFLPGVKEGLKKLSKDFIFIIITNQSGIGSGIYMEKDMHKFNDKLVNELKKDGVEIKKVYYCPHKSEHNCSCRKPEVENAMLAKKEFKIDLKNSWVIGDHLSDVELGIRVGSRTVYMLTGHGKNHIEELKKMKIKPDFVADNFLQATDFILSNK